MKVLGIIGWSGSGKTTFLVELLIQLRAEGVSVSTIKHAHHGFDMDRPGKDSFRHREAGAHEVLVTSGTRWALLHETVGPEPGLAELLGRLDPVDLVLVEGYKSYAFPKLEVHRPSLGKPPIWLTQSDVVAVATDEALDVGGRSLLPLNDPPAVVAWLRVHLDLPARARSDTAGDIAGDTAGDIADAAGDDTRGAPNSKPDAVRLAAEPTRGNNA